MVKIPEPVPDSRQEEKIADIVNMILVAKNQTFIGEIMTEDLITVTPDSTIDECMRLMTNKFIRHLPVVKLLTMFLTNNIHLFPYRTVS